MWIFDAENSYQVLLVTQALHLLHHRIAKRHISFAEVISGLVLCVRPSSFPELSDALPWIHLTLVAIQIIGSLFIKRLSPNWQK
jgi:hypothetical protein